MLFQVNCIFISYSYIYTSKPLLLSNKLMLKTDELGKAQWAVLCSFQCKTSVVPTEFSGDCSCQPTKLVLC